MTRFISRLSAEKKLAVGLFAEEEAHGRDVIGCACPFGLRRGVDIDGAADDT